MDCKFETRFSDNAGCGNCNALLEKKDPMKLWQEMKRNGFLSPPAFTPTPNKRASKHKNEMPNRKMKFAKIEQTNRFTEVTTRNGLLDELNPGIMNQLRNSKVAKVKKVDKFSMVAAPSGLLNELNPGIMSRLRNSEQVYSIIWALVRSEMLENTQSKQESRFKEEIRDNDVSEGSNTISVGSQVSGCSMFLTRRMHMNSEHRGGVDDMSVAVRKDEDGFDKHEVKSWSSVTTASENANSNDEIVSSENTGSQEESAMVPPFDRTVANLASQWLVLLCQNIKGRLAALKRSRMRVKDVIQVELPFLVSKESSPVKDNDQLSSVECPMSTIPYMHQAKWTALFDQMDKALSEEMNDLEIWLNQIEEMQLHVGQLECKTDIS
ncbi:uncharacterized protein LOC112005112 [Quercus suber]|uniref:uncharacterized protein LOC112005112 n=1 Tax=Quercus suber TaxID=58331 RepID=UPI000CE16664|nr:uncharacterized protein LOC112005112 [Quercus suber]POE60002.1 hypothetical protein CFP56_03596 [Quercus suber]